MTRNHRICISLATILFFSLDSNAQQKNKNDFSGTWSYEVKNTPSGDFFGNINLRKVKSKYVGEIVNDKGMKDSINFVETKGNKLVFTANVEDAHETFTCTFFGDSIKADIDVQGDSFLYKLRGKRVAKTKAKSAK